MKRLLVLLCGMLLGLPGMAGAVNKTQWLFSGTPYATAAAPYDTSMFANGWFNVSAPLPANMLLTDIGPGAATPLVTEWGFSDGVNYFSSSNSMLLNGASANFRVSTDASGIIVAYQIGFMSPLNPHVVGQPMNALFIFSADGVNGSTNAYTGHACQTATSGICTSIAGGTSNAAFSSKVGIWSYPSDSNAVNTFTQTSLSASWTYYGQYVTTNVIVGNVSGSTIKVGDFGRCTLGLPYSCNPSSGTGTQADPYTCTTAPVFSNCSEPGTLFAFPAGAVTYDVQTYNLVPAAAPVVTAAPVPLSPWVPAGSALGAMLLVLWMKTRTNVG